MAKQHSLDRAYMRCAYAIAEELSQAQRKKVGAILVAPEGGIIAEGLNGTFSGADNNCEEISLTEEYRPTRFPYHLVSNLGSVKRLEHQKNHSRKSKLGLPYIQPIIYKEKILPVKISKKGYGEVKIDNIYHKVHILVAEAFIINPSPERYNQINHIDRIKSNNIVTNLEWCTNRYNSSDRSQQIKKHDLPLNINRAVKGKFQFIVQYYENGRTKSKRCVTLEEAIAIRNTFIDPNDYITYKYIITNKDLKTKPDVLHAESNCIMKIARSTNSSKGATLYTTLMPCFECSKLIIQAGIRRVVFSEYYPYKGFQGMERPMGLDLLARANILVEQLDMSAHSRQYDCSHDRELEATEPVTPDDASSFGH